LEATNQAGFTRSKKPFSQGFSLYVSSLCLIPLVYINAMYKIIILYTIIINLPTQFGLNNPEQ